MTRLPSVTVRDLRRIPAWRVAAAAVGFAIALAGFAGARQDQAREPEPRASLARAVAPANAAARVPYAWLAAAPPRLTVGDRVDLLAARPGDRGSGVVTVASDARVLELDTEAMIVELVGDDAATLASARASGYTLFAILRASR